MSVQIAPFGAWRSPITSKRIVAKMVKLLEPRIVGDDVYWIEIRPEEKGRYVIVRCSADGTPQDVIGTPFSARSRVHEYGGGSYVIDDTWIFFSNCADQRIYRVCPRNQAELKSITSLESYRYADAVIDRARGRLICVREDHTRAEHEPINTVAAVELDAGGAGQSRILISGADFYAAPRLSPDGHRLAWLCWNHPNMPWDSTELWIAGLDASGVPREPILIAGGRDESILQPEWSGDSLYFLSDRSGWWNLYRWRDGRIEPLIEKQAEFGEPPWTFGQSSYVLASAESLIVAYRSAGRSHLAAVNTDTGEVEEITTPYTEIAYVRVDGGRVVFLGGSPTKFPAIVALDLATRKFTVLRRAGDIELDSAYVSAAEPIEFPSENGFTAYAFFYRPRNHDYTGPEGARPPLIVTSHGGPTSSADSGLNLAIQYWTSRGIAVLDVNYGGSSGFGRAYRRRLDGQWGITDVDDCVNGARYLVERGWVDRDRLAIRGGSAGGYTTLSALAFRDIFKAGASHYGVSDLEALAKETHKFESHYLERLIGPYPQMKKRYRQRSPIHAVERLSCPVIFFQGLEDRVVPPDQAEKMVQALRRKKLPVAYLSFPGEQHGFRQAETIKRVLDAELYFYARVFDFELADPVDPVAIEYL
ncbi:MAG: prolyl oligopeptidase family serine peptidase [Gammaproteobacteria bacterium]